MARAVGLLSERYPQYRRQPPGGPVICVQVDRWTGWAAAGDQPGAAGESRLPARWPSGSAQSRRAIPVADEACSSGALRGGLAEAANDGLRFIPQPA